MATYEKSDIDHRTGHKSKCGGDLHDSIVNFVEDLPVELLERAFENAKHADLCLILGSSLMVHPANEIPRVPSQSMGAKLAICNLQKTPLDNLADLRIQTKTNNLMIRVMKKLEIPIPPFILDRRLVVEITNTAVRHQLKVYAMDTDNTPVSFLKSVKLDYNRRHVKAETFDFPIRDHLDVGAQLKFELESMGHYGEPNLEIMYDFYGEDDLKKLYIFSIMIPALANGQGYGPINCRVLLRPIL